MTKLRRFIFGSSPGLLLVVIFFLLSSFSLIFLGSYVNNQNLKYQPVKKEIGISGGEVRSKDGKIGLAISAGEDLTGIGQTVDGVKVKSYELVLAPKKTGLKDKLAVFSASAEAKDPESEKGKEVTQFSQPITLSYVYDQKELGWMSEGSLHFEYFNQETGEWEEVETKLDKEKNILNAETTHLSLWSIGGNPGAIVPETINGFQTDLFSGTTAFSYPINLPSGAGGLAPSFALTYSSNVTNQMTSKYAAGSWVGMGWNLDIGYVYLQNPDGGYSQNGVPALSVVLNGERHDLIKNNGDIYDYSPGWYRTRIEKYLRIQQLNESGNKWWRITDQSGTVYEFGETVKLDNLLGCERNIVKWPLEKIKDRNGNTITIDYKIYQQQWTDPECPQYYNRDLYPEYIYYTTNSSAGDTLNEYEVKFVLEDKGYPTPGSQSGIANWETKRLAKVKVLVWDIGTESYKEHSEYQFSYTNNTPSWGQVKWYYNLLTQIQIEGTGTQTLPAMTFNYGNSMLLYYRDLNEEETACYNAESYYRYFLRDAENGYGGKISFEHENWIKSWPEICPEGKGWSRQRVTEKTDENGQSDFGADIVTDYSYSNPVGGGVWNNDPFIGWANVTAQTAHQKIVSHFYAEDTDFDPLNGKLLDVSAKGDEDNLFTKTEYSYEIRDTEWGSKFPKLIQKLNKIKDGDSTQVTIKTTYDDYDDYGNLTKISEYGKQNPTGDERITEIDYYHNTSQYIHSKIKSERVYEGLSTAEGDTIKYTTYLYDGGDDLDDLPTKGNLTEVRNYYEFPLGQDPGEYYATKTTYDDYGNSTEVKDALNHATTTDYHSVFTALPIARTNAKNQTEEATYNLRNLVVTSVTDVNGLETTNTQDQFGRVTKVIRTGVDSENYPLVEYVYYDGNPSNVLTKNKNETDSGINYVESKTFYDGLGRAIQTQSQGWDGQTVVSYSHYNWLGKPNKSVLPYFVSQSIGNLISPDWDKPKTTTSYDDIGRPYLVTDAQGNVTETIYDDLSAELIDGENHKIRTTKDAYSNLIEVKKYQGEYPNETEYSTTSYEYDMLGNLTKITAPNSIVTEIEYDALGRRKQLNDPDLGTWNYNEYDAMGNLKKLTDDKDQVIQFQYDELNRITKKDYPAGTDVDYFYDGTNAKGKLIKITDGSGETRYAYDARSRLEREEVDISTNIYAFDYDYDTLDRLETLTFPDQEEVVYGYNTLGQLGSVIGDDTYLSSANYDNPTGKATKYVYGNGDVIDFGYDTIQRLSNLESTGSASLLQNLDYSYDGVSNLTQIVDSAPDPKETLNFSYDDFNRLTAVSGLYSANYTYDENDNLTYKKEGASELTLEYNATKPAHAPYEVNDQTYTYDGNGNLTNDDARVISYDYDNRPSQMTYNNQTINFTYNGEGRRIKKEIVNGETVLYPSENYQIAASSGEVTKHYLADGKPIAVRKGNTLSYIHSDHLGSTSIITNDTGVQTTTQKYYPYGMTREAGTLPTEKQFTGHVFDDSTDLYYMKARYYNPEIGRFITPDIQEDPLARGNRYLYSADNPINVVDLSGSGGRWFNEGFKDYLLINPNPILRRRVLNYNPDPLLMDPLYFFLTQKREEAAESGLGNVEYLNKVAWELIGDHSSLVNSKKEFVEAIAGDAYENITYDKFKLWIDEQALRQLQVGGDIEPFIKLIIKDREHYRGLTISQRLLLNKAVCFDLIHMTNYTLATLGEKPGMINFSIFLENEDGSGLSIFARHSVGHIVINGSHYIYDVTNWDKLNSLIPYEKYFERFKESMFPGFADKITLTIDYEVWLWGTPEWYLPPE